MRKGWKRMPVKGFYRLGNWTVYRAARGMVFAYRPDDIGSCAGPFDTIDEAMQYAEKADLPLEFRLSTVH